MDYEPATHTTTERALARLPSGGAADVTVHRYVGGDGPTLYVQAAQHGIELNGPAVLRRLHERLVGTHIAGTVVAVPVANPLAFDHRSYMTPAAYDALNPNLNRVWPGDEAGSLAERMAAGLWASAEDADAVLDLHTGSPDMLEHVRFTEGDTRARTLAERFGTAYLLADEPPAEPEEDDFRGKLRSAAALADIPAVTAELSNSRQIEHSAVMAGLEGVWNVLKELDMLESPPESPPEQSFFRETGESATADTSGLFEVEPTLAVGDRIEAGDDVGVVYDPSSYEDRQRVEAPTSGLVYSLAREGAVVAGEQVAAVAEPF